MHEGHDRHVYPNFPLEENVRPISYPFYRNKMSFLLVNYWCECSQTMPPKDIIPSHESKNNSFHRSDRVSYHYNNQWIGVKGFSWECHLMCVETSWSLEGTTLHENTRRCTTPKSYISHEGHISFLQNWIFKPTPCHHAKDTSAIPRQ